MIFRWKDVRLILLLLRLLWIKLWYGAHLYRFSGPATADGPLCHELFKELGYRTNSSTVVVGFTLSFFPLAYEQLRVRRLNSQLK